MNIWFQLPQPLMNLSGRDIFKTFQGAVSVLLPCIASLNRIYGMLVILMTIDIIAGVLGAFVNKKLDSRISFGGMTRKAITLLVVATAAILGAHSTLLGVTFKVPLGEAVAGYYCINEVISIIENAGHAGVPIPDTLLNALAVLSKKRRQDAKTPNDD